MTSAALAHPARPRLHASHPVAPLVLALDDSPTVRTILEILLRLPIEQVAARKVCLDVSHFTIER